MITTPSAQTMLKLLVKGFPPFERRIIEATARTSKKRPLYLKLLPETELDVADVVIVDGADTLAMEWAQNFQHKLINKTVIWIDSETNNPKHISLFRPVLWVNLPIIVSRLLDDISVNESLRKISQNPRRFTPTPSRPKSTMRPRDRGTVMIVDDSQAVRQYLEMVLTQNGYKTIVAEDGEQAIEKIKGQRVDCVLMDVLMPGMDGYKACRMVLRDRQNRPNAVVMLTGKTSPFDKIRGKMAGCSVYLAKPIDVPVLLKVVNQYVDNFNNKAE